MPDEIRIAPLADGESAYITGDCSFTAKPSVAAVIIACGVRDGHGVHGDGEGDLFEFERLVPDPADRERILQLADEVMKTRQFKAVRDALRRRLQFADVMYTDEIAKIATAATGRPVVA